MYKIFLIILFSVITISKTSATANSLLELENFVTAHRDTKSLCLNKYSRLSEADLLTSCVQEQEKGLAFVDIILSLEKPADWAIRTIRRNISKYQGQNEYVVDWSIFGEDLNNELTAQNDVIFLMQMKQLSKDDESICYEKYKDYSQIYENVYNCLFEEEYKTIKNNISKKTTGTSNIEEHSSLNTNNFVSPINFNDTKENRNKVIAFIKQCVKTTYCKSEDKCNPITLRIMEKANLNSFKNIMNPKSIDIMKKTISIYCHSLPCCQYITIEMMYNQMLESENSKLEW